MLSMETTILSTIPPPPGAKRRALDPEITVYWICWKMRQVLAVIFIKLICNESLLFLSRCKVSTVKWLKELW